MIRWRSLGNLTLPAAWTLLPLRLVVGVGFLLHGLAKLNRGPAKFALLLEHIGAPFLVPTSHPLRIQCGKHDWLDLVRARVWTAWIRDQSALYCGVDRAGAVDPYSGFGPPNSVSIRAETTTR